MLVTSRQKNIGAIENVFFKSMMNSSIIRSYERLNFNKHTMLLENAHYSKDTNGAIAYYSTQTTAARNEDAEAVCDEVTVISHFYLQTNTIFSKIIEILLLFRFSVIAIVNLK